MIDRRQFLLPLAACALAGPAAAKDTPYRAPRTRDGAPSLEGTWTNASYTELQRPKAFKALTTTEAEATAWEARLAKTGGVNVPQDPLGQATSEFPETGAGLARIRGQIRTSLIVDPADGQIPYSAAAKRDLHLDEHGWRTYDNPEDRPDNERCLASAASGAPTLSTEDANVVEIVQTREHVVVVTEKYHDARIIRLPGAPAPKGPPSWLGDSVGRWEGDTLVVETANLAPRVMGHGDDLYLSGQTRIAERFTRISPRQILYEFAVTDPYLFTQAWRGEIVFNTSAGRWFEYACHEGNYSIVNILAAARLGRQAEPKADEPKPEGAKAGGAKTGP